MTSSARPLRVLFVCTGNICRSPMAAALLLMRARDRDVQLSVASCGLLQSGRPATAHGVAVMNDWGVDMSQKLSRQIDVNIVRSSDLVLAMSTHHARRAVGEDPSGRDKIFLLRELAELAPRLDPPTPGQDAISRIRLANELRTVRYNEDLPALEVEDPIGQPLPAYQAMQSELNGYVTVLLDHILVSG